MKKQRWEENREMIEEVKEIHQGSFVELSDKYEGLKTLVDALVTLADKTADNILKAPGVGIKRPGQLKNMMKDVKKAAAAAED